jgi:hypothetical protein
MSEPARYLCCEPGRRNAVAAHATLNGLEALEVIDRDLPLIDPLRQRTLLLFFLKPVNTAGLTRENIRITGGERVRDPVVEWAEVASLPPPQLAGEPDTNAAIARATALTPATQILVVRLANAGDYSPYTLHLVQSALIDIPPAGFDARLARIEFSFKAECPSEFDCRPQHLCPPEENTPPDIDYLARDFGTLRRLMLDRFAQIVPDWNPRSLADGGVALIELMAYVGDQLAYRQDAIATEAYLGSARRRVSLRRHAHLVDYEMHDGCNARAFVDLTLAVGTAPFTLPASGVRFLTRCNQVSPAITAGSLAEDDAMRQHPLVFEPLESRPLRVDHNRLDFHTWSDSQCCLPVGATRATLRGSHPHLVSGQWLLFEERIGPRTGAEADADPIHRQVVRLLTSDPGVIDQVTGSPVTEIVWADEDALEFPLCISAVSDAGAQLTDVSIVRGNVVLVDHGMTLDAEDLGVMPKNREISLANDADHCGKRKSREIPPRFRPILTSAPVTQAARPDLGVSAKRARQSDVDGALPQISLSALLTPPAVAWQPKRSLLDSDATAEHFVVEVENDGRACLRFGNNHYGRRPTADTRFSAIYRVGNGTAGNVGAGAIAHVVGALVAGIDSVRNALPADHGVDPESNESVRRRAPEAFRRQERAVTPADYTAVTEDFDGIERASSRMRWTGSWHTMFVTVDRTGGAPMDRDLRGKLTTYLDRFRMAGHDVDFEEPIRVSLQLSLHVCVAPDYFRSDVKQGLLDLFTAGLRRDGRRGLFHPDNFSFGDIVYLSPLLAAAREVPGVASVTARAFGRQNDDDPLPLEDGRLKLGPREIARLDNDPNFPEHGVLTLELHGGK